MTESTDTDQSLEKSGADNRVEELIELTKPDHRLRRAIRRSQKVNYAQGVLAGLKAGLGPGSVFVDCGAHHGETTLAVASTGATIHAFEPDPRNWVILTKACARYGNVTLHNAAVSTQDGSVKIYGSTRHSDKESWQLSGSTILADNERADKSDFQEVEAISLIPFLRKLIEQHGLINALKIDIEGAELELLEDMLKTDIFDHIRLTLVETHRWLFPKLKDRYAAVYDHVKVRPDLNLYLHWI